MKSYKEFQDEDFRELADRELNDAIIEEFRIYFERYHPIKTSARLWDMYLLYCKYLGELNAKGQNEGQQLEHLAEDLRALHEFHTALDAHLLRAAFNEKKE